MKVGGSVSKSGDRLMNVISCQEIDEYVARLAQSVER